MTVRARKRTDRLDHVVRDAADRMKAQRANGVDKRVTAIKALTPGATTEESSGGLYLPNDEQLSAINNYTLRTVGAEEVRCFDTLSANDIMDRDNDKFDTGTVEEFAALPDPYGPTGKSFMLSHDYDTLPVGRIFATGTEKVTPDGADAPATFLTNSVYVPNTDQYKSFLENQEFGIYWAVSVGVMLEELSCGLSWCGAPMSSWGYWCMNGHDKGFNYVENGEEDSWGYPIPVEPGTKNSEMCFGWMKGARDFYELSQVFLGAQFFAALDKKPSIKGVIKSAAAKHIPVVGLTAKEATEIPLQHVPDKVRSAVVGGQVTERGADGSYRWKDSEGLIWLYEPGNEVLCLGKSSGAEDEDDTEEDDEEETSVDEDATDESEDDDTGEEDDEDGEEQPTGREPSDAALGEGSGIDAEASAGAGDERNGTGGSASSDPAQQFGSDRGLDLTARLAAAREGVHAFAAASEGDETTPAIVEAQEGVLEEAEAALAAEATDEATDLIESVESALGAFLPQADSTSSTESEDDELSKKAVLAAATKARVPADIIRRVSAADGNGLDVLLREVGQHSESLSKQVEDLTPRAELGDEYIATLRAEAVDWYVKAHQDGEKGVSTASFEKILDACGKSVDLVRSLRDEQKGLAQAKFPKTVRRTTVPTDPNEATGPETITGVDGDKKPDDQNAKRVRRLHR